MIICTTTKNRRRRRRRRGRKEEREKVHDQNHQNSQILLEKGILIEVYRSKQKLKLGN